MLTKGSTDATAHIVQKDRAGVNRIEEEVTFTPLAGWRVLWSSHLSYLPVIRFE